MGSIGKGAGTLGRRRFWLHYPLQPSLKVQIESVGQGSKIACHVVVNPVRLGFIVVWFGLAALMCVFFTFQALIGPVGGLEASRWAALVPNGVLAWGILFFLSGRWLARRDAAYLLAFVRERTGTMTGPVGRLRSPGEQAGLIKEG